MIQPLSTNQNFHVYSVKAQVPNKIKAMPINVPNKPKPVTPTPVTTVTDSSSFMDALSVSVTKKKPKKVPTSSTKGSQQPSQPATSPVDKRYVVISFHY